MFVKILKRPESEGDSYLIEINGLHNQQFLLNSYDIDYFALKRKKFKDKDISRNGFEKFSSRPSLRCIDTLPDMRGSIYTYAVADRNDMNLDSVIKHVKEGLQRKSRKMYGRMCNALQDYVIADEGGSLDVSCLSNIHYLESRVHLVFRASDIQNELYIDLLTIYESFILPVYGSKSIMVQVYASTSQNVKSFDKFIEKLEKI